MRPIFLKMKLSQEIENVKSLFFDGKTVRLDYVFCADLKFINETLGLGSCSSEFSCAWCKGPANQFWDMSIEWSFTDPLKGARTIQEIERESRLPGRRKDHFACIRPPMFSIEIYKVIMDPLHWYLRVSDQLIRQLVKDIHTEDNVKKNQRIWTRQNVPI